MDGLPVIIRLLDPPLHEFLPKHDELLVEVTELRMQGETGPELRREASSCSTRSARCASQNPMLGLRGCRLGILFPEINEMQVRAILEAAVELKQEGMDPDPEIMIPLVGDAAELRRVEASSSKASPRTSSRPGSRRRLQVRHDDRGAARRAWSPARSPRRPSSSASAPTT